MPVQFVLAVEDDACDQAPFPTFVAAFDAQAVSKFHFADVDRLFIRNLSVAHLSLWVHGEVDLANKRAAAQSDPIVREGLLIVSAPIMIIIDPRHKTRFVESLCEVHNAVFFFISFVGLLSSECMPIKLLYQFHMHFAGVGFVALAKIKPSVAD